MAAFSKSLRALAVLSVTLAASAAWGETATIWLGTGATLLPRPNDPPPRAAVPVCRTAPAIDGKLDDPAWAGAARLSMGRLDGMGFPGARTEVLLCRDAATLYVAYRLDEPNVRGLRRKVRQRDGAFWDDDSVEMFLQPAGAEGYYHIGFGAGGALYDSSGQGGQGWDSGAKVASDVGTLGWTVELAVPLAKLTGGRPAPADWRANFNRARFAADLAEDLAWSPTFTNSSHMPDRFGYLSFGEAPPATPAPRGRIRTGIHLERTAEGALLRLDLSALPKGAKIHHASLRAETIQPVLPTDSRAYMSPGYYDPLRLQARRSPQSPVVIEPRGAGVEPGPLKLEAPRYLSFDVTTAVRRWLADGQADGTLIVKRFDNWAPDATVLEVVYEGEATDPPPQVRDVRVIHRKGQTFITFREIDELIGDQDVRWKDFERFWRQGSPRGRVLYRVYRSDRPITAANLAAATRIDEVGPLSGYDGRLHQHTCRGEDWTGLYPDNIVPRYCITPSPEGPLAPNRTYSGLPGRSARREWRGEQIPLHTGLYVHRPAREGKAYYAVTSMVNGVENTRDISPANAPAEAVPETVGPGEPILYRWLDHPGERAVRESQFYLYWAAPPQANLPRTPIHVLVGVAGQKPSDKMRIRTAVRDMYWSELLGGLHPYEWGDAGRIVTIVCDAPHDGEAYHPSFNTLQARGAGTVQPYVRELIDLIGPWAGRLGPRKP